jgi:hypothetical protein
MFMCKVQEHLNDFVLDTITNLPNLTDVSSMCSIRMDYSKYTDDIARIAGMLQASKYDTYDKVNDKAACRFVLSSLDKELRETLHM